MSFGAGTLAPAAAAGSVFGPGVGTAVGAAIPTYGFASQALASNMRSRYADIAELTARNGGTIKSASQEATRRKIIEALMGSQAASQSGN